MFPDYCCPGLELYNIFFFFFHGFPGLFKALRVEGSWGGEMLELGSEAGRHREKICRAPPSPARSERPGGVW